MAGSFSGWAGSPPPAWRGTRRAVIPVISIAPGCSKIFRPSPAPASRFDEHVFQQLGGFDHENLPRHFYDVDLCLRLREHGLQIIWTPYASLSLEERLPEAADASAEADYMKKRWGRILRDDPFYNPNLSLERPGFILAVPPRPNEPAGTGGPAS